MNLITIFPYCSRIAREGGTLSPKNYPYWEQLVEILNKEGYEVIQVSSLSEEKIKGVKMVTGLLPFESIIELVKRSKTYISVDSFAPHLFHPLYIRGVVIFGLSDPEIYGYLENINILKSRKFLKPLQFENWSSRERNDEAFYNAEELWNIIKPLI